MFERLSIFNVLQFSNKKLHSDELILKREDVTFVNGFISCSKWESKDIVLPTKVSLNVSQNIEEFFSRQTESSRFKKLAQIPCYENITV